MYGETSHVLGYRLQVYGGKTTNYEWAWGRIVYGCIQRDTVSLKQTSIVVEGGQISCDGSMGIPPLKSYYCTIRRSDSVGTQRVGVDVQ